MRSSFRVLDRIMQDDYRDKVVQEALEHYAQAAPPTKHRLENALSRINIKGGFRNPLRAPLPILKPHVIQATKQSDSVWGAILNAWLELHKNLQDNVYDFLVSRDESVSKIEELGEGFTGYWTPEEMQEAHEAFQTQNPDFDDDDVKLMLCCLTGRAPLALIWVKWFHELQELPADSPEWDSMPEFVKVLEHSIERNRQAREGTQRLQRALETLITQTSEELDHFEYSSNVSEWTAEARSTAEAGKLVEEVERFTEHLKKHGGIRHSPQPAFHSQDLKRREELEQEEKAIKETYRYLSDRLTPPPAPEPPPRPGPGTKSAKPQSDSRQSTDNSSSHEGTDRRDADLADQEPLAHSRQDNMESQEKEKDGDPIKTEKSNNLTLHASKEIAIQLHDNDRKELWHGLLWAFVYEDELPAAYWLAAALEQSADQSTPIPSALLAAVQGARWLPAYTGVFVQDLLELTTKIQPSSEDAQTMTGVAAALCPSLIAPGSGMHGWLKAPSPCPALHNLVEAVKNFSSLGIALQPEDLQGATGADEYQRNLDEASEDAQRWLQEAPRQRLIFKRASDVWRELATPKGRLNELVSSVAKNNIEDAEKIRRSLTQWEDRSYAADQIRELDRQLVGRKAKSRPIQGSAHQKLMRNIENVCGLVRRWCDIAMHIVESERHGSSFLFDKVNEIKHALQASLPEWQNDLNRLTECSQPADVAAAAFCLDKAVRQLEAMLNSNSASEENSQTSSQSVQERLPVETDSLQSALKRFLLWLPELSLDNDGYPSAPEKTLRALRDFASRRHSLHKVFHDWLERQDYRFADDILRLVQDDETKNIEWSREYQERIESSRQNLQELANQTEETIEQALVDGIISEEIRAEYDEKVNTASSAETLNFRPAYTTLRKVKEAVSQDRARHLKDLETSWRALAEGLSGLDNELQKRISERMQEELERKDTRVVEELIALLQELEPGKTPDERWRRSWHTTGHNELSQYQIEAQRFQRERRNVEAWLQNARLEGIIRTVKQGGAGRGRFAKIPAPRREEAIRALSDWRKLKQIGPKSRSGHQLQALLRSLLHFLGFSFESEDMNQEEFPNVRSGQDWLYTQVQARQSLVEPIPQFGSQAQGSYDLVCLWQRPGVETIAARLQELRLSMRNVLIVYLGRLTKPQQRDIIRTCRERELALAFLDETLVVFLAQQRDTHARFPVFLRCSLPYTALNPYTPFQAGDVPPEMFFGRKDMIRELQDQVGSCLVYGGRQLGKSALLRHVERQFHHPEQERFAWIEDLQLIFDPNAGRYPANVWKVLRDKFKKENLLSSKFSTDDPEKIAEYIRESLRQAPQRRILVMFDEADDFLDADSKEGFRMVLALRKLMLDTQRRFKVIFAGLHNVGRFQGIANQPLAHFGTPLRVGPLEPSAARQLVQQPFEALGFNFVDASAVLRVLSYTNYHPGLIQHFCQVLLKHLRNRTGNALPPYQIERKDVEDVYRDGQVREAIRERFDWTLALDPRYQVITWTIISDQKEKEEGGNIFRASYPRSELLELVSELWPQGFKNTSVSHMRSLLVELEGLGVLAQDSNQRYRLRSPNLVRLMGTVSDIETRLLEASEEEPRISFDADSHHASFEDTAHQSYSPLCYVQERNLTQRQFGVGLISASEALGFPWLEHSIKRFYQAGINEGVDTGIPDVRRMDSQRLGERLESHLETHRDQDLIVYVQPSPASSKKDLQNAVEEGLEFCRRRRRTKKRWLRVLFLFDAATFWTWLSLPPSLRKALEDSMDAVEYPQHWTYSGVQQRLEQHQKLHSKEVCETILEVTGGWPLLLDELFKVCENQDDPRAACRQIQERLAKPGMELNGKFRQALGLEVNEAVTQVLNFVCQEDSVPSDMLSPEFIETAGLNSEECRVATEYLLHMGCISKDDDADEFAADSIIKQVV